MTTPAPCTPGTVPAPTDVPNSASVAPPAPGGTVLVTKRDARVTYTANQETDSRSALSRAVREYAEQLVMADAVGGRPIRFARVLDEWAEGEDAAAYPSACAYAVGEQAYDPNGLVPGVGAPGTRLPLPDGRYLAHTSNLKVTLRFEVYAVDKEQRAAVFRALESAFAPVDWMYGFRLDMPHYFGARAVFAPLSASYDDSEETAAQRWRRGTFTLEARGPVIRLAQLARMTAKADVTASVGGDS